MKNTNPGSFLHLDASFDENFTNLNFGTNKPNYANFELSIFFFLQNFFQSIDSIIFYFFLIDIFFGVVGLSGWSV